MVSPVTKIIALGVGATIFILFAVRSAQVGIGNATSEIGSGLQNVGVGIGTSLGSVGSGIGTLGAGIGYGVSKLFDPLFTLKNLIYGQQSTETMTAGQVNPQTAATTNPNTVANTPSGASVANPSGNRTLSSRVGAAFGSVGRSPSGATLTRVAGGGIRINTKTASISHLSTKAQAKISSARARAKKRL